MNPHIFEKILDTKTISENWKFFMEVVYKTWPDFSLGQLFINTLTSQIYRCCMLIDFFIVHDLKWRQKLP